jgi:hypothetical protein
MGKNLVRLHPSESWFVVDTDPDQCYLVVKGKAGFAICHFMFRFEVPAANSRSITIWFEFRLSIWTSYAATEGGLELAIERR